MTSFLDSSLLSLGGMDATARFDARKSLSSSQIGRASFVGRGPPSSKKAPFGGRLSIAPGGDRRLSMAMGKGHSTAGTSISAPAKRLEAMLDPRPTSSAAWKSDAAQKVFDFLTDSDYPQRISVRVLLVGPTAKDFGAILTHLLRLLDPSYVMAGKLEDEVVALSKALAYPFPPSKTAIATVGAAHSWPALLGLLSWTVELLRYHSLLKARADEESSERQVLSTSMTEGAFSEERMHAGSGAHFWWFLRSTYSSYLAGEDSSVESLSNGVSRAFDCAAVVEESRFSTAETNLSTAANCLEQLHADACILPHLRRDNTDLEDDVSRLTAALREMEEYRDGLAVKADEKAREMGMLKDHLKQARDELSQLHSGVASQEMGMDDAKRISGEVAALRVRSATSSEQRAVFLHEAAVEHAALRSRLATLDARLHNYHEKARGLQLVPKGAKYSFGADFSLRLEEDTLERASNPFFGSEEGDVRAAASALVGADMRGTIKHNVRHLRTCFTRTAAELRAAIATSQAEAAAAIDTRAELLRAVEEAEAGSISLEAQARKEAEVGDARLAEGVAEVSRIRSFRDEGAASAASAGSTAKSLSPHVLTELAASISSMQVAQNEERQRISDLVARTLLRVSEHKQGMRARLDAAAAAFITAKNQAVAGEAARSLRLAAAPLGAAAVGGGALPQPGAKGMVETPRQMSLIDNGL